MTQLRYHVCRMLVLVRNIFSQMKGVISENMIFVHAHKVKIKEISLIINISHNFPNTETLQFPIGMSHCCAWVNIKSEILLKNLSQTREVTRYEIC